MYCCSTLFSFYPHGCKRRDPHTWLLLSLVCLLTVELFMSQVMTGNLHVLNATAPIGMLVVVSRGMRDERSGFGRHD